MIHIGDFALAELVGPDGRSDTPHLFTLRLTDAQPPDYVRMTVGLGYRDVRYIRNGRHPSGLLIYRRI